MSVSEKDLIAFGLEPGLVKKPALPVTCMPGLETAVDDIRPEGLAMAGNRDCYVRGRTRAEARRQRREEAMQ